MPGSQPSAGSTAYHGLPAHEVVLLLGTDSTRGLSEREARARLERFGPNVLPAATSGGILRRLGRQLHNPLIYVLIASGTITSVLGEYVDSSVIFGVVVLNGLVGFVQESRAEAALDSLRALARTQARVVRDGRESTVSSDEVVPGDLVVIDAGDRVPADVRLVRVDELQVDESALTGESELVRKDLVVVPDQTPVSDRRNVVYSGTLVGAGTGRGVTVATGSATELGEIHRLVVAAKILDTPLTLKIARFSTVLTVAILALAAVTFGIGVARGQGAGETFIAVVALAVGAIPEGLPAAVTITLAIGVSRMARRRAVARRLPVVETLGSTTVICTDKTGTLTENQMTVRQVWTPDRSFDVSGTGYDPAGEVRAVAGSSVEDEPGAALTWCLLAGAGCNDARLFEVDGRWEMLGDPTEAALLVTAAKGGVDDRLQPRVATIPFSSERQYMATLHRDTADGEHTVLAKGAVERVVDLCATEMLWDGTTRPMDRTAAFAAAERLAGEGLRVLATAIGPGALPDRFTDEDLLGALVLTGLQAMHDPPRSAAAAAVRACRDAGIAVKMVTGDHAATAVVIARRIGLDGDREPRVITGSELAELGPEEYPAAVDGSSVFARVSPEQKLRLVEALQASGHVVAMTGDGVNDAPALRQANIGIAMGRGGTEVAKDAADMVLVDDDFATIEAAVEEGRGVFDNITKFVVWTLPTNMAEGMVILLAILLGSTLPILPTQILWINMTTAVALGLMLAFEPREAGIMTRPPRDPDEPLLTRALLFRTLLVSALLVGGTAWMFAWERGTGAELAEARTVAVNLFVTVEIFYLFSCRSLTRSPWRLGLFSNRFVLAGVAVQVVGQLALTYLPAMNRLFHTAPIGVDAWLRIAVLAVLVSLVVTVDKYVRGRRLAGLSRPVGPRLRDA